MAEKHSPRRAYKRLQNLVAEREPFNEEVIHYRDKEDIAELLYSILKGLEIINGVEVVYVKTLDGREDIYEDKKPRSKLTKKEQDEMKDINTRNKNVNRSKNSLYPLTSIAKSRYIEIEFKMRYTHGENVEEMVYSLYYPELVNGEHFLLNGKKFFPIFQLADAEFYRAGGTIVLKTTFMPVTIRGDKTTFTDYDKDPVFKDLQSRRYQLSLFKKKINVLLYFFAKFGVNESIERFGLDEHIQILYKPITEYIEENETYESESYLFRLNPKITLVVSKEWMDSNLSYNSSMINTLVDVFKDRHIDGDDLYSKDYWIRLLGREFTTNTNKAEEKAHSIIISVERLLDETTQNNLRIPEEEKDDIFRVISYMIKNYESIVRIDNYDLANKRIRVAEYLLYPLTFKLSQSVYRLINDVDPSIRKMKQIFSSLSKTFIVDMLSGISLIRFNNQVNSLDLFARTLKGSKDGPQSQAIDSSGTSIGVRGIDSSYIGRLDIVATSSNTPGISFTVTPFTKVYDPSGSNSFFFTESSNIDALEDIDLDKEIEIDVLDIMENTDDLVDEDDL